MKNLITFTLSAFVATAVLSGCLSLHTWPDEERSAENKMVTIQEKIGGGLKTGTLSPDQSQMFLTELKSIRTGYELIRDQRIPRDKWNSIQGRLDALGEKLDRTVAQSPRVEDPRFGDRILTLQRRLDDGRISGRLPQAEEREFQARLDFIRSDYLRMSDAGRKPTYEQRSDISRRLDSLEVELNRLQVNEGKPVSHGSLASRIRTK
jgi:hypothetical protein